MMRPRCRRLRSCRMLEAFLTSAITMATPILLAALGELLVEESGVINIGIEGAMLAGAFVALAIAYFSGSTALGLAGAIAAGVAINAIFAMLVVNLAVNQVVTGTAVSILALGLTGVFYRKLFGVTGKAFMVAPIAKIPLGPLARIPLLGPVLFNHNALVYFTFILVPALWYVIARTRYGLRLRACGERPETGDALGLGVIGIRWQAMIVSGAVSGLAWGFFTLSVVILGRWNSWSLAAASVLFGAAMALQFGLQALGTVVPYQLFLALPYALTLVVLAGVGGQAGAPGARGG